MSSSLGESLVGALVGSYSGDTAVRKAAEAKITELCLVPGAAGMLLQVSTASGAVREARQAGAIALKNLVKRRWEDQLFASPEEQAAARTATLEALLREKEATVRDQLAEVVDEIARVDFPKERWQDFVPRLVTVLRDRRDTSEVQNALLALRKLCKRFEFKGRDAEARRPLEQVVGVSFGFLRDLLVGLVEPSAHHVEAAVLAKLVLKIFWSCTQMELPDLAKKEPNFLLPWFDLIRRILEIAPSSSSAESSNTRDDQQQMEMSQFWKMKKWAAQIASRFLVRYGRSKYVELSGREFARLFCSQKAPLLLEATMGLLAAHGRGAFVSARVRQLAFTYLDSAVEIGALYKLVRPHLDFVLFDATLPALCATERDVDEFDSDPQEYVRRSHDPMEDFLDPRAAATNLVGDLVKFRRGDVLDKLLKRLAETLNRYEAMRREKEQQQGVVVVDLAAMRAKDGALCALGALSAELSPPNRNSDDDFSDDDNLDLDDDDDDDDDHGLGQGPQKNGGTRTLSSVANNGKKSTSTSTSKKNKKKKKKKGQKTTKTPLVFAEKDATALVNEILSLYVLPEMGRFEAKNGFLRARSCWVVQRYADHLDRLPLERVGAITTASLRALEDPALPVRVEAAGALRQLLQASKDRQLADLLRPSLPQIFDHCFRIMGDVGSDDVVQALEVVIDKFGDEIAPYAVALAQKLAEAFETYAMAADDDDEASMAAAQCVEAMAATLQALDDNQNDIYGQVEPYLVPVLGRIFAAQNGDLLEYFENAVEVLGYLTWGGDAPFSANLWRLFELLIDAFHGWAYDYINDLVPALDNYVSRDTRGFLEGYTSKNQRRVDALLTVADRFLGPNEVVRASERDAVKASYILLAVFHNCPRGSVDDVARTYAKRCADLLPMVAGPPPLDMLKQLGLDREAHELEFQEVSNPAGGCLVAENRFAQSFSNSAAAAAAASRKPWRKNLAVALVNVWSSLLFYDPTLALSAASSGGAAFFSFWLETSQPENLTPLATKLAVLGFSSALSSPAGDDVQGPILHRLVDLLGDGADDDDQRDDDDDRRDDDQRDDDDDENDDAEGLDTDDESEEESEDGGIEEVNFDEDVNDPEDDAYLAALERGTGLREIVGSLGDLDDDVADDEAHYLSPIDNLDEGFHALVALQKLHNESGDLERLAANLPPPLQERLHLFIQNTACRAQRKQQQQQNQPPSSN